MCIAMATARIWLDAQAIVEGDRCRSKEEATAEITGTRISAAPPLAKAFPDLPPAPPAGGPGAIDPGTRTDRSFTSSDAVDDVSLPPVGESAPPGVVVEGTADTTSTTDVTVRPRQPLSGRHCALAYGTKHGP